MDKWDRSEVYRYTAPLSTSCNHRVQTESSLFVHYTNIVLDDFIVEHGRCMYLI